MFFKLGVLKNFANFTEKHLCQSLLLINFVRNRPQRRWFPVKFAKFLRTPFFVEHLRLLLLIHLFTASFILLCFQKFPMTIYEIKLLINIYNGQLANVVYDFFLNFYLSIILLIFRYSINKVFRDFVSYYLCFTLPSLFVVSLCRRGIQNCLASKMERFAKTVNV